MTDEKPEGVCMSLECRQQAADYLRSYRERSVNIWLSSFAFFTCFFLLIYIVVSGTEDWTAMGGFFASGGVGAVLLNRVLKVYEDGRQIITGQTEIPCSDQFTVADKPEKH